MTITVPSLAFTGTQLRSVLVSIANKLNASSNFLSVKDEAFGTKGDGTTDDTAAIQAAIDAAASAGFTTVWFPPGRYRTTSQLTVSASMELRGSGQNVTNIYSTHAGNCIVFQPTDAGTANVYLSGCGIADMAVTRTSAAKGGSAVWLRQTNGFEAINVAANNHDFGFRVTGGQLNRFIACQSFASAPYIGETVADSAGWLFERADLGEAGQQYCYTVECIACNHTSGKLRRFGVLVYSVDGLNWTGGYAAFANTALWRFERQSNSDYITAVQINGQYLDCVDDQDGVLDGTPHALEIVNGGTATGQSCRNVKFSNTVFANNDTSLQYLVNVGSYVDRLSFSGCDFLNSGSRAINIKDSAAGASNGVYKINDCAFANTNNVDTNAGAVFVEDAERLVLGGNIFSDTGTAHVVLDGTIEEVVTYGNSGDDGVTLVSRALVTISRDTDLDAFRNISGMFTPTLTLGGAAVGMTYGAQTGRYTRHGDTVSFRAAVTLTAKGSSTGEIRLHGLPYAAADSAPVAVFVNNLTENSSDKFLSAQVVSGSSQVRFFESGAAGGKDVASLLSDAALQADTTIEIAGTYFTDAA